MGEPQDFSKGVGSLGKMSSRLTVDLSVRPKVRDEQKQEASCGRSVLTVE